MLTGREETYLLVVQGRTSRCSIFHQGIATVILPRNSNIARYIFE